MAAVGDLQDLIFPVLFCKSLPWLHCSGFRDAFDFAEGTVI